MSEKSKTMVTSGGDQEIKVKGGIHAGRDVIMGDQYNIQEANINTPDEFVAELERLKAEIESLKQQPELDPMDIQTLEVVAGRVEEATKEAKEPTPVSATVSGALGKAKKMMDSLSGGIKSAVALGKAVAGMAEIAGKLFGM